MRPILMALFGGLIFLMALPLMRVIIGIDPDLRYGLSPFPRGMLAYLLAIAITGGISFRIGRLMYQHG